MKITQEQFYSYLDIQQSGVVNMYDVTQVSLLSHGKLSTSDVREIMSKYSVYKNTYSIEGTTYNKDTVTIKNK